MDLTETEDIKKRWQEYTEELYKKDLHDPDNHDGVMVEMIDYEEKVCKARPLSGGCRNGDDAGRFFGNVCFGGTQAE